MYLLNPYMGQPTFFTFACTFLKKSNLKLSRDWKTAMHITTSFHRNISRRSKMGYPFAFSFKRKFCPGDICFHFQLYKHFALREIARNLHRCFTIVRKQWGRVVKVHKALSYLQCLVKWNAT